MITGRSPQSSGKAEPAAGTGSTALRLQLLGSLDLRGIGGARIDAVLARPKRLALLAYLAIESRHGFCPRDRLLALFWPELDQRRARRALNQALYVLNRELGRAWLEPAGREGLSVSEESLWCDAVAFERAAEAGQVAAALELYRGDLLDGFFLSGTPEFESWTDSTRTRLRAQAARAAWTLAARAEAEGDLAAAADRAHAAAALSRSPLDEEPVQRLVSLLARVGNPVAALAEYDAFTLRLRRELGLAPSRDMLSLVADVRARLARRSPVRATFRKNLMAPAAARSCTRGRRLLARRNRHDVLKAALEFHAAIETDPRNAAAYAGLAQAHVLLPWYGDASPVRAGRRACAAAGHALEIDPSLAEPHAVLAAVKAWYADDRRGAEGEFRRALELDPGQPTAHQWRALSLALRGELDEAVAAAVHVRELDPASPVPARRCGHDPLLGAPLRRVPGLLRGRARAGPGFRPPSRASLALLCAGGAIRPGGDRPCWALAPSGRCRGGGRIPAPRIRARRLGSLTRDLPRLRRALGPARLDRCARSRPRVRAAGPPERGARVASARTAGAAPPARGPAPRSLLRRPAAHRFLPRSHPPVESSAMTPGIPAAAQQPEHDPPGPG